MELVSEDLLKRRVSWGSIFAGVVTVLAISLLLTTLGTSLGLAKLSINSDDIINGADKTVLIWSVISIVFSLACGGYVAGRLAGADGTVHGFLTWATSLLVASVLGAVAAGGILNMTGNAIGSIASASNSVISGLGTAASKTAGGSASFVENIADSLGLDSKLSTQKTDIQILEAFKKNGIKQAQPEYLQSQLEAAGKDVASAVKNLALHAADSDSILDDLKQKLKARSQTVNKDIDPSELKNALTANTQLTPQEVDRAVDKFIKDRNEIVQDFNQRMSQVEKAIDDAIHRYAELVKQTKEKADAAAKAGARITFWSFIGLLVGALVSAYAGLWGVNKNFGYRNIKA